VKRDVEHIAAWFYVAGSIGAIFAGDFITLFLFWELMALSSVWGPMRLPSLRRLLVFPSGSPSQRQE
jgi:hypothetical protein